MSSSSSTSVPHNIPKSSAEKELSAARQKKRISYALFALFLVIFLLIAPEAVSGVNDYVAALLVVAVPFLGTCFYLAINEEEEEDSRNAVTTR